MKKRYKILLFIMGFLIIIRLLLPSIIKEVINTKLAKLDGYSGSVEDVNLFLYKGGMNIINFNLIKNGSYEEKLLEIKNIDLSIEWKSVLNGDLVAEVYFEEPIINLVQEKVSTQAEAKNNFEGVEKAGITEVFSNFSPIKINTLGIKNSKIKYTEQNEEPIFDIFFQNLNAKVTNITNSLDLSETKVANYELDALLQGHSATYLKGTFDPFDTNLTFDIDFKFEDLKLVSLNGFLQEYMNVDAEKGTFQLYTEIKSESGEAIGYIKPLINDSKFLSLQKGDSEDGILQKLYEGAVGGMSKLIQNPSEQQIGSKIEFTGSLDNPKLKTIKGIISLLKNALIDALEPEIEYTLNK